jgi:hypothetical protein
MVMLIITEVDEVNFMQITRYSVTLITNRRFEILILY